VALDDLFDIAEAPAAAPAPARIDLGAPSLYVPPPVAPKVLWPADGCSVGEADAALRRALEGEQSPEEPLLVVAHGVIGALSDLERAVLAGVPQPLDAAPIRAAAVMRVRVAAALAAAPAPGSGVDGAALGGLLGEIDGLLAQVGGLVAASEADVKPSLEAIRNALVREAIDFSEAGQRISTPVDAPRATEPSQPRRAGGARVLSVQAGQDQADAAIDRRSRAGWIALAVVVTLALAYHGWRYLNRPELQVPPVLVGAPSNTITSTGGNGIRVVISKSGKLDPGEVARFKAEQELKGCRVEVVSPGMLRIFPATPEKK
jgi:hypothetical protein